MVLTLLGAFGWSAGPLFYGFWFLPIENPLRFSFDPTTTFKGFSFSTGYQRGFSLLNQGFLGLGYKNFAITVEDMFVDLPEEDEYRGRYNEFSATAGYTLKILEGFNLGISLSYFQISNPRDDIGTKYSFGANIGAGFKIYEFWHLGIFSKNLNSPDIGGFSMPTFLGSYLVFSPRSDMKTAIGVLKDQYGDINYGLGGIWRINDLIDIMASLRYDGNVPSYFAGFSLNASGFNFIAISNFHPDLPLSFYAGLGYR